MKAKLYFYRDGIKYNHTHVIIRIIVFIPLTNYLLKNMTIFPTNDIGMWEKITLTYACPGDPQPHKIFL